MKWSRIALLIYWLALFAATHYPSARVPDQIPQSDKLVHFAAFAVLALLFWRALATRARGLTSRSVWVAAAVLMPYAVIDEYTQQLVGRHTDPADALANLGGIACVLAVLEIRRRLVGRES